MAHALKLAALKHFYTLTHTITARDMSVCVYVLRIFNVNLYLFYYTVRNFGNF